MFDIGWTEMLVIAVVMIVVVGPKDLPKMLRTFGKTTAKLRSMAGDFQKQFNEALKEAELDDVKKSVEELRSLNPAAEIRKQLNPFEKAAADVRAGFDNAMKPTPRPSDAASGVTHAAEPLKNGATVMPGVAGPDAMPTATPVFPAMTDEAVVAAKPAAPEAKPAAVKLPKPAQAKAEKPAPKSVRKASAPAPAAKKAAEPKAAAARKKPAGPVT